MVQISSNPDLESPSESTPISKVSPTETFEEYDAKVKQKDYERKEVHIKSYYFDNEIVENLMHKYVRTACTSIPLRDQIMSHASELIRQVIKAHNLDQIYPGREESSIMDLFQTAWLQIESALYKYECLPYCSKCYNNLRPSESILSKEYIFEPKLVKSLKSCPHCKIKLCETNIYYKGKSRVFNMWSQIARTVILAYIKKENRDRKNSDVFKSHLEGRTIPGHALERFFLEAREISKYDEDHILILDTIEKLYKEDDRAHEGLITKLVSRTNLSRAIITDFLKMVRMRSNEYTDSPINEEVQTMKSVMGDDNDDRDD